MSQFGGVNILVNNAAAVSIYHIFEMPEEEWDRVMNTNLKGYFLCSRAGYGKGRGWRDH